MAKPVINYKGYMTVNPADRTGAKICIPQIVDRNQVKTLESIVEEAIDRGLIAGLKPSAAAGVAQGIMIQLGQTLNSGTGIIFGDYFAVRPYLTGTIENLLAPITADNNLRVRFVPGSAYRLDEKNFSFHNVTPSENVPVINDVVPGGGNGKSGYWRPDADLNIVGKFLKIGDADVVEVWNCDGETPVKTETTIGKSALVAANTDPLLTVDSTVLIPLESYTKLGFKVVKTVVVDDVETKIESDMFEATKAA